MNRIRLSITTCIILCFVLPLVNTALAQNGDLDLRVEEVARVEKTGIRGRIFFMNSGNRVLALCAGVRALDANGNDLGSGRMAAERLCVGAVQPGKEVSQAFVIYPVQASAMRAVQVTCMGLVRVFEIDSLGHGMPRPHDARLGNSDSPKIDDPPPKSTMLGARPRLLFVSGQEVRSGIKWKLPLIPISLSLDTRGTVSVDIEGSVATPIGTFSIFTEAEIPTKTFSRTLTVITPIGRSIYELKDGDYQVELANDLRGRTIVEGDRTGSITIRVLPESLDVRDPQKKGTRGLDCELAWSSHMRRVLERHRDDVDVETNELKKLGLAADLVKEVTARAIVEDYEGAGQDQFCSYRAVAYKDWGCSKPACDPVRISLSTAEAASVLKRRADRLRNSGRNDLSLQLLRRLVAMAPEDGDAWEGLGDSIVGRGNLVEALRAYARALHSNPRMYSNKIGLRLALLSDMIRKDEAALDEAINLIDLGLNADRSLAGYQLAAGFFTRKALLDKAADSYAEVVKLSPGNATVIRTHSHLLAAANRPELAEAALNRADFLMQERQRPNHRRFQYRKGLVYDRKTRLVWTRWDSGLNLTWDQASRFCRELRLGGFSDWRLPSLTEASSLYDPNDPGHLAGPFVLSSDILVSGELYPGGRGVHVFSFSTPTAETSVSRNQDIRAVCVRMEP